ncbi:MAG: prepilin-type N-terminal cleavage/methylation domain-containing protein [Colwellia sp.]|nr:prepilin-type N-terminal cleavage/methylation domain-containing protein [Colwellia sp.]
MNSKGFTLIELVVVIVILGILAVTVVPKYINLQADAKTATLAGVKAAMQGGSALVYGKSIVAGNQKLSDLSNPKPTITLSDGTVLDIKYGYPTSNIGDWKSLLDIDLTDFFFRANINGDLFILPYPDSLAELNNSDCRVRYRKSVAGEKPEITLFPCE